MLQGNTHVVYNGSFYYNQYNTDLVVRLDLTTLQKISKQSLQFLINPCP